MIGRCLSKGEQFIVYLNQLRDDGVESFTARDISCHLDMLTQEVSNRLKFVRGVRKKSEVGKKGGIKKYSVSYEFIPGAKEIRYVNTKKEDTLVDHLKTMKTDGINVFSARDISPKVDMLPHEVAKYLMSVSGIRRRKVGKNGDPIKCPTHYEFIPEEPVGYLS